MSKENLAFIFPGQGSQKVGMLEEFAKVPVFASTFEQASEVLGYDLWETISSGPQEKLDMTEITQPALLASSVAMWRVWQEQSKVLPAYVAGHSLGEWSALVCANVVDFGAAIKLVRSRGQYMQEAVPAGQGSMAAIIGLDDASVEKACLDTAADQVVAPVNYNSPGQLVIAGDKPAVDRAIEACLEAGARKAMPLSVSAPFHTSLMKPAADRLALEIAETDFRVPSIPVVHNVTAKTESDPAAIKLLMVEQIYSAVRWVDCINTLATNGVELALECGPGRVLSGLNRRINKSVKSLSTQTESALQDSLAAFAEPQ